MVDGGLAIVLTTLLSAVFVVVGWTVLRRRPEGPGRLAASAFAAWWLLLAVANLGSPIDAAVRAMGGWGLATYLAWTHLVLLILVTGLGCLMYYLLYLFTGRRGTWVAVALAYLAYYVAILTYIAYGAPVALDDSAGGTMIEYERDLEGHWATTLLGVLLILPPLAGAVAYFSLIFRVEGRTQRFRIAMISGAFIIWFASALIVGQATDLGEKSWWPIVSSLIGLGASLAVLAAFRPPSWIRRRLHVRGFGEA